MQRWLEKWTNYKYRFVPWIVFNLKNRTVREVPSNFQDKVASNDELFSSLKTFFNALDGNYSAQSALKVMRDVFGYQIEIQNSSIPGVGRGVFVTSGSIPRGRLVALYPGTVYWPYEPIMLQSVGNQFVFRCIDGIHIDGNDSGISKIIYRSIGKRDELGPYAPCDSSWLGSSLHNPLAIGQYVNNGSRNRPANVAYQELDIQVSELSVKLMKYVPNVWYGGDNIGRTNPFIRTVTLVSTCDIKEGEELFSSYFTVVN
ncbi:predicted protein [Nematostella vectensis]|uniref:SET domain-containing protein n=1 Tax=Nematostella vectensis TaxID=45351 RepID=A7RW12_NEMVE|nr:SET domain-containing protein 9 [Nematostella vectensis]EDO44333.1 predicted protein [Nematostella vectensis]|eukprot:XP_001636396.1 predicted protein [Nematostella vectensis]